MRPALGFLTALTLVYALPADPWLITATLATFGAVASFVAYIAMSPEVIEVGIFKALARRGSGGIPKRPDRVQYVPTDMLDPTPPTAVLGADQ